MTDIAVTLRPQQGIQCEENILYLFDPNVVVSITETATRQWLDTESQNYINTYIKPILDAYEQDKEREIDAYVEEKQSTIFFDNTNLTGTTTAEVLNVTNSASFNNVTLTGSIDTSTATFTDVIKMRASVSFKGAIAPSWKGIGIYELNDDDSVSLMASMEKIDGFTPASNNTYNIGVNSRKWKDLYLAGKAYIPTINNGGDITVPASAGTMARVEDIENKISNCITKIPQDINLELNNGTLTLKAGSKVYNGNGLFAEVQTDSSIPNAGYNGQVVIVYTSTNVITTAFMGDSVASLPSPSSSYKVYYNTTDKKCYLDIGSWLEVSFPIALATSTITEFTSIDQVFNGFGYVGSTTFALPDVEGLIPDGRNEDGTLKSFEFTISDVKTFSYNSTGNYFIIINKQENIAYRGELAYYDEKENLLNNYGSMRAECIIGKCYLTSGVISNLEIKTSFHALDYSDTEFIGHQSMPSDSATGISLGASGTSYTPPSDGYVRIDGQLTGVGAYIEIVQNTTDQTVQNSSTNNQYVRITVPISKGYNFIVNYTNFNVAAFYFIYANGTK